MAPAKKVIEKKIKDDEKAEFPGPPLRGRWMSTVDLQQSETPFGLHLFNQIDELSIEKMIAEFDLKDERPYKTKERYQVYNGNGKQAYYAFEQDHKRKRKAGFSIHITDHVQREVLLLERSCKNALLAGLKPNPTKVKDTEGNVIGAVHKKRGRHYVIVDDKDVKLYDVTGKDPFILTNPATGVPDGAIGKLSAKFSLNHSWKTKALLLCAVFVVYFHEYDKKK